jgi:hypothetical protein
MVAEGTNLLKAMNRDAKRFKKRRGLWLASCVLSFLCCVLLVMSFGWHKDYRIVPPEPLIGNKASSLGALKEKGFPFSFLVMGDPQSTRRGTALIKRAIKEGPSSFMIILGDFVNDPDIRYHNYFMRRMAREVNPPFPVFLAAGNHDIDYRASKKIKNERRVTPEGYESLYGPRNFDFIFNDCLFIICEIDAREPGSYLNFLRDTLSQKGKGRKHIFIFMHHPPNDIGIADDFPFPKQEEFFSLLETYHVTSCFFGDYHAYWRVQRKGTNLIVSGGGGGSLKKVQPEWGKFHHLLRITVDENSISEGMMILPGAVLDIQGTMKKWMFIQFFPIIKDEGWILYVLFLCFLAWGLSSVIIFSRLLKETKMNIKLT